MQIPPDRMTQAKAAADILGDEVFSELPFAGGTQADGGRQCRRASCKRPGGRNWRSPPWMVIRCRKTAAMCCCPTPSRSCRLRLPPTCDAEAARQAVKRRWKPIRPMAPRSCSTPRAAKMAGTRRRWRRGWRLARQGQDGRVRQAGGLPGRRRLDPLHGHAGREFPGTQFVITGVLGPHSNAHGPNEFLHIASAKRVSGGIAQVLADHAAR